VKQDEADGRTYITSRYHTQVYNSAAPSIHGNVSHQVLGVEGKLQIRHVAKQDAEPY
jgi:hypothetical protein